MAPYLYYVSKQADPLKRISVNWARLWLERTRKSWERTSFDYETCTCTVTNTATGNIREFRIVEKSFRLPGDNVILLTDESVNRMREELMCGR